MTATMRHLLLGHIGKENVSVDVDAATYEAVCAAARALPRILAIEEKFDMLAENYDELEGELDAITRRYVFFGSFGDHRPNDLRQINRRVVNFMSSARLYLDQVDHDLNTLFGAESAPRRAFAEARSAQYDSRLGFEVFEALRNYSQHRGIPVHALTYGRELRRSGSAEQMANSLRIALDPSRLEQEGGFKSGTLAKLKSLGSKAELKPLLREYMSGLRSIHSVVRRQLGEFEEACERAFLDAEASIKRLASEGQDAQVWDAARVDQAGNYLEMESIYVQYPRLIFELRTKNARLEDVLLQVRTSE